MDARRVADTWRQGATGEWASQAAWVSGLASWRLGDCQSASRDFNQVAALAQQRELRAGCPLLGRPLGAGVRPSAVGHSVAEGRRGRAGKLLRPRGAGDARHGDQARRGSVRRLRSARRPAAERPARGRTREDRRAGARRGDAPPPGEDRASDRASCADPARQAPRPPSGAAVAGEQWPAGRAFGCDRSLSQSALESAWRVAGRSGARFRPHRPGIRLPPHRGEHGRRGRADAGTSGDRAARLAQPRRALYPRRADRSQI